MSGKLELTFACGDYEIMRALKEGIVRPEGIELTVLTDMAASPRHWRFLRGREFDIAEVSGSGYVAARDQGLPFRAIPVFPHRRFRHGFIFINTSKGISKPKDLIGRKVGTKGYLFTAGLWMRGILEHDYGVPHTSMEWVSELDEDVDFIPPPGLELTQAPHGTSLDEMLANGEIDALFSPDLIEPLKAGDKRVGRLFRPSCAPRRSPWSAWRTRASCRWPGIGKAGRSRKRSWARTHGNMGSASATGTISSGSRPILSSKA